MLMKNNKSQGMPINIIIIAAVALVVLVVMIAIFTGKIGNVNKNLDSCTTKNGKCAKTDNCQKDYPDYPIPYVTSGNECKSANNLCCLKAS